MTLNTGGTIDDTDSGGSAGLGTGTLILDGGEMENISGATAILSDPIVINGDATISSSVARLKLSDSLDISGSGALTVDGDLALTGTLTGSGAIIVNGGELAVANSNPTFSGKITLQSGTVEVVQNDALGTGSVNVNTAGDVTVESVSSIGDPVLDNPFTVESGTLILDGQFTFPQGIVVDTGATLEITGSGTAVNVSGPLSGSGAIDVVGGTFSSPGGSSGFTGSLQLQGGQVTPTLTVTDAGGVYNGSPFAATALLTAVGTPPAASLQGVSPTFTYYTGSTATGTPLAGAPSAVGTYTVVGNFAGSADYAAASSGPVTFSIVPATSSHTVIYATDLGGVYTGKPYAATGYVANSNGEPIAAPVFTYYLATDTKRLHPLAGAPSAVGSYYFVATFAGNSDYLPSTTTAPFTITRAPTVIHASDPDGVYSGKPHAATGYVADPTGKPIATPVFTYYLATDTKRLHPLAGAPSAVGSYYFVATFGGNSDYLPSVTSAPFTISKAPTVIHTADLGGIFTGKPHTATGYVADPTGKPIATPVFTYYLATDTKRLHPLAEARPRLLEAITLWQRLPGTAIIFPQPQRLRSPSPGHADRHPRNRSRRRVQRQAPRRYGLRRRSHRKADRHPGLHLLFGDRYHAIASFGRRALGCWELLLCGNVCREQRLSSLNHNGSVHDYDDHQMNFQKIQRCDEPIQPLRVSFFWSATRNHFCSFFKLEISPRLEKIIVVWRDESLPSQSSIAEEEGKTNVIRETYQSRVHRFGHRVPQPARRVWKQA